MLRRHAGDVNASGKRQVNVAFPVHVHRFAGKFRQFGIRNLELVAGAEQVCGMSLAAAFCLHFGGHGRRRNLRHGVRNKKECCRGTYSDQLGRGSPDVAKNAEEMIRLNVHGAQDAAGVRHRTFAP